jgi:hypothetical protein
MKRFSLLFALSCLAVLHADTLSKNHLNSFYDQFLCEEKDSLAQAGLTSSCSSTIPPSPFRPIQPLPNPPTPTPPVNPSPPPSMSGLLPIVIVNNSGLPDDEVYILVQGRVPIGGPQVFVDFDMSGVGTNHVVSVGDNGMTYTQPLSSFPSSSDGHVLYLPQIDSFIVLISLQNKLNIPVLTGDKIADPAFNDPSDPYNNYTTIWDQVEGAYVSTTPNINVDTTAVAFFSIPLYVYLSTPNAGSASNCGLSQTRASLMSYLQSALATVPPAVEAAQWKNLVLKNGSTIYRVISPGKAIAGGFFDQNYLDNAASYGYSYISDIWSGPNSFYKTHPSSLSIKIPNGSTYTGTVQGDNSILFVSGGNQVVFAPPTFGPPYTSSTSYLIFSGLPIYSSATIDADGVQVSKAFQEAVIAGIIPTTSLIDASTSSTLSSFKPYYRINPNLTGHGPVSGPWYDLYSASLHACGSIYTFTYDEPLWPEVLLQSDTLQAGTYIGITIGNSQ